MKNSKEQSITEKLRALLIFGVNDKRYKDIYDMYYLIKDIDEDRLSRYIKLLIFDDRQMRENSMDDIIKRVERSFADRQYLKRISTSRQRWIDEDVTVITEGIIAFLRRLAEKKKG